MKNEFSNSSFCSSTFTWIHLYLASCWFSQSGESKLCEIVIGFKKWTRCSRRSKQTFLYLLVAEEHLAENLGLEWIQEVYKLGYHLTGAATSTSYSRTIRRAICSAFVSLAVHVWDWTRCPVEMFRKITLSIEGFSVQHSAERRGLTGVASLAQEVLKLWILIPEYIQQWPL